MGITTELDQRMPIAKHWMLFIAIMALPILTACSDEHEYLEVTQSEGTLDQFEGKKYPAKLSQENALTFLDALYPAKPWDAVPYSQTSTMDSEQPLGLLRQPRVIIQAALQHVGIMPLERQDYGSYDFNHCAYGGSSKLLSNSDVKRVAFTDCRHQRDFIIHGEISISSSEKSADDTVISFKNLKVLDAGESMLLSGVLHQTKESNTLITNVNLKQSSSIGGTHIFNNVVWQDGETDSVTGRIYQPEQGFTALRASTDLVLDTQGIPIQGELILEGEDLARAKLKPANTAQFGAMRIELDAEGDGFSETHISKNVIYESQATFYAAR